jgi:endonuclease/exonuclease/phosphatase family metal-dependent hydrolase
VRADTAPLKLLAGDLNTTDGTEVEVLREFRPVGLVDHGGEHTNPSNAPYQRLDYVLVPASARLVSTFTPEGDQIWRRLSDHLPVVVQFER